jgi:predicted O-linked N-acetylglucosamine transferase (SPINDLY family)
MATIPELLSWGLHFHQAGDLAQAEQYYREILQYDPYHPDALHLTGEIAYRYGRHDIAMDYISRAIQLNPYDAAYHCNLGVVYQALGRHVEATASLERARELQPNLVDIWNNLGVSYKNQGRLDDAVGCYRQALQLRPDFAFAHNNLGGALAEQGKTDEAIACYYAAIRLKPDYAEAYNNLGNGLAGQQRYDEAIASFQEAIRLQPNDATAYNNMGTALGSIGRQDDAVAAFRQAIAVQPNLAVAHNNLGATLGAQSKLLEAVECYQNALAIEPNYVEAYSNLAGAYADLGMIDEARASYEAAHRIRPNNRYRITIAMLLPLLYDSMSHLKSARKRLTDNIQSLVDEGTTLDVTQEMAPNPFFLAYQGLDNRELLLKLRRLYAPPPDPPRSRSSRGTGQKLKVGFISAFFKNHTIGRLMRGLIEHLSRDNFTVTVFSNVGKPDDITESIRRSADQFLRIPANLPLARQMIAEQGLDVLLYTDIGMDPFTYTLAFSRLAPVQCVTWGHPDTTAMESIDYFISSELFELPEADRFYTETLVRLKTLPAYAYRTKPEGPLKDRDYYSLPSGYHLYACLQSIFKLHPEFDEIIAGILRADSKAILVFSEGYYPQWREYMRKRFSATMPDVLDRIYFMGWLRYDDFLNLNAISDVLLDPMHFGGGRTSYEALSSGLPIVTLPSQFLRGRMSYAMYQKMKVLDCVAWSQKEYIDIAVKLGNDPDYRAAVRSKILAANSVLYEDRETVREFEDFFEKVAAQAR